VSVLVVLLVVALLAAVVFVVSAPLRAAHRPLDPQSAERDQLEAAREAKYREIRDAELDFRTGKLSREDYQAVDGALRREALEILNRLEG
jgi:flagellar biosynthesis/type III secretory pathway M-ring protein FliF/YscJ